MPARLRVDPLERPWLWIAAVLLVHGASFAALPPHGWLVRDEVFYVAQAEAFAAGKTTAEVWDGARGQFVERVPSLYPPGTSLLMALPVRLFGQRGALLVPWLASIALVLATGVWLQCAGHSSLFALLTLAYPPTLVLARLAMSDAPSAAFVACALALFGFGVQRARLGAWLGAGLLGGASLCLRESNPLLLLPLWLGAVCRRERHAWALLVGTAFGAAMRPLCSMLVFGDALFYKPPTAGFSAEAFVEHVPIYVFAALCFVPGGLYWVLRYRGPRRAEVVTTAFGFIAFYAAYGYAGSDSGLAKSLVLAPRYLIPLTPLLAFCAADAFSTWRARAPSPSPTGARLAALLVAATTLLAIGSATGMHRESGRVAEIRTALAAHVSGEDLVVTNLLATEKLLFGSGHGKAVDLQRVRDLHEALAHAERVWVVLLDRNDSARWRAMARTNRAALRAQTDHVRLELALDRSWPDGRRLRIHRVRGK